MAALLSDNAEFAEDSDLTWPMKLAALPPIRLSNGELPFPSWHYRFVKLGKQGNPHEMLGANAIFRMRGLAPLVSSRMRSDALG